MTRPKTFALSLAQSERHQPPQAQAPAQNGVVLRRGDNITPRPVSWLWKGWLAHGKLHLVAGAPGTGKTTIAVAFCATVTIGGRWPDGTRCPAGNVLIYSSEDDPSDTLLPRLMAAGADRSRVFFVDCTYIDGVPQPFDVARDIAPLRTAAARIGEVALIVVDPIVVAVTADSHKNTETRRALQPLVDLAADLNAALVGITHFSKGGQGGDPAQRVIGSVAFTAVARVVMAAAKVKGDDGKDRRILARAKSNIGPDGGGFEYHLDQVTAMPGIEASRVTWGESVAGTARELLSEPDTPDDSSGDAAELLRAELASDNWTPADVATLALKNAGFTKKQIWAASKTLGVIRKKGGMQGGWYWRLPTDPLGGRYPDEPQVSTESGLEDSEGSEDSSLLNVESSESSAETESSATRSKSGNADTPAPPAPAAPTPEPEDKGTASDPYPFYWIDR